MFSPAMPHQVRRTIREKRHEAAFESRCRDAILPPAQVNRMVYRHGIDEVARRYGVTVGELFAGFKTWFWAQPSEEIR